MLHCVYAILQDKSDMKYKEHGLMYNSSISRMAKRLSNNGSFSKKESYRLAKSVFKINKKEKMIRIVK